MPVAVGLRSYEVTIQHGTESAGASRFPVETFLDATPTLWMSRDLQRGSEAFQSDQLRAEQAYVWRGPYVASLDPDLVDVPKLRRLTYSGRTYDILSASVNRERSEITLLTLTRGR